MHFYEKPFHMQARKQHMRTVYFLSALAIAAAVSLACCLILSSSKASACANIAVLNASAFFIPVNTHLPEAVVKVRVP